MVLSVAAAKIFSNFRVSAFTLMVTKIGILAIITQILPFLQHVVKLQLLQLRKKNEPFAIVYASVKLLQNGSIQKGN